MPAAPSARIEKARIAAPRRANTAAAAPAASADRAAMPNQSAALAPCPRIVAPPGPESQKAAMRSAMPLAATNSACVVSSRLPGRAARYAPPSTASAGKIGRMYAMSFEPDTEKKAYTIAAHRARHNRGENETLREERSAPSQPVAAA